MLDVAITGGTLIDGTGAARRRADIGILNGRIVAIGAINRAARSLIDAEGLIVAPGFIDPHTHYDAQVFWDPLLTPSSLHGVTTVVAGNCGFSIAPLVEHSRVYVREMLARVEGIPLESLEGGAPWDWSTTASYFDRLTGHVALNMGFMVGHSAIRRAVMNETATERTATAVEISAMAELLRRGLAAGGLGFSSSHAESHSDGDGGPVPSRFAAAEELIALAAVCREFEGTSLEFIPTTGRFEEPHKELMTSMSVAAQRPLNWNAIHPDASNLNACLDKLAAADHARERGGKVVALTSPKGRDLRMSFATCFLLDTLDGWGPTMSLPRAERLTALRDPTVRRHLAETATGGIVPWISDWSNHVIVEAFAPATKQFEGRTVGAIAREQGKSPLDALLDIVCADRLMTAFQPPPKLLSEADWQARLSIWRDERVVIGASDAGAHIDIIDSFNYPSVVLGTAVRERNLLSLEEAVQLLTSTPARLFGIKSRGRLVEGAWADITIFDANSINTGPVVTRFDLPGGAARLYAPSVGIHHVLVNGVSIIQSGTPTSHLPGAILRSGIDTENPSMR